MSHREDTALSLLGGVEFKDSRMYDLLSILIEDLYSIDRQLNPPVARSFGISGIQIGTIENVTGFTAIIFGNNVRLTWNSLVGASYYDIRYKAGVATAADWNTANSILQTTSLSADINPINIPLIIGSHTFLIKSVNSSGLESETASIITITIIQIPVSAVTAVVIDNNVLLSWTTPASQFNISYYNIYKNGVLSGTMDGTFEAIFETISGEYEYSVEAVDIVGNIGVIGSIIVTVNQPPDYELQDSRISVFGGTLVNVISRGDSLYCCVDTTETWDAHFSTRTWANIQDQINAGYPIYIQPTKLTGSYEEVIDYGTIISSVIATLRWTEDHISGTVAVIAKLAASDDNITYTPFVTASSTFFSTLRYLKIRFEFTAADDNDLLKFSNINILLSVKREVDSGSVNALASDVNGTIVAFNKSFKDIDSITLTVNSVEPVTAIYSFVDIPNPVSFSVFAFDSSGNRVTYPVSWKARGIV